MYQSRRLSDGGRVFFNSDDGLVPQDVNGMEDVYEWEREGVGRGQMDMALTLCDEYGVACVG
jgi:hypothetical protein